MTHLGRKLAVSVLAVGVLSGCGNDSEGRSVAADQESSATTEASQSGCRFATLEEIGAAVGIAFDEVQDRGPAGCLYRLGNQYLELTTFATPDYEQLVAEQLDGVSSGGDSVPNLGVEAVDGGPNLFVKTRGTISIKVLKSGDQSIDDEIAVAELVVPRVEAE